MCDDRAETRECSSEEVVVDLGESHFKRIFFGELERQWQVGKRRDLRREREVDYVVEGMDNSRDGRQALGVDL